MPKSKQVIDESAVLKAIVQGTSTGTGEAFFQELVKQLAEVLNVHGAWVTEFLPESLRLKAFAFRLGDDWVLDYEYDIKGTPCEPVIKSEKLFHVPDKIIELYPDDPDLAPVGAVSYMGVPLLDINGNILGHLAILDNKPMPKDPRLISLFNIFAARAAAELQRLRAEKETRDREEKLSRLVNGAMDAIIDLDSRHEISLINPAAETMLGCKSENVVNTSVTDFLSDQSCEKFDQLILQLDCSDTDSDSLWIPGGLIALKSDGSKLATEATLSKSALGSQQFYTLILRNVNERIKAEETIGFLTEENERLELELSDLREEHEIIGDSKPMQQAMRAVQQVSGTDASVLLLGETGTGKELFARAIHNASLRKDKVLVNVNCAAIPANLIESEFFGHEKGAFTGATARREGRFALADGGSIFLDEVGELPIDLQSKLLRVLQEGEFEMVGGSRTHAVDVRVIAATNRDLRDEITDGKFREDLYFRLNVFPIEIPKLSDRSDDVHQIATALIERLSQKMNRPIAKLSDADARLLLKYEWPGNVRELQNVIERALITSSPGQINLQQALPSKIAGSVTASVGIVSADEAILSAAEVLEFEKANFVKALESCNWKISGAGGAATLLGMKPTTLTSRLKSLDIGRPE